MLIAQMSFQDVGTCSSISQFMMKDSLPLIVIKQQKTNSSFSICSVYTTLFKVLIFIMSSPQWVDSSSTRATVTRQACWPPGACWAARAPGLPARRASIPATRTQTPRSTGRSRTASTRWRGGWSRSSRTPWRAWLRRRRRRRPRGWSCFSTRLPGQCDPPTPPPPHLKHWGCDNLMEPCRFMITKQRFLFAEIATSTLWGWTRRASWSPCRGWGKVPLSRRESLARRTTARERRTEACAHPFILPIFCPRPWSHTVCAFKQRDLATEREGFKKLFLSSFLGNSRLKCRAVIVAHWLKVPVYFLFFC